MSEIPEDVMRAARNAAEFYAQWLHDGNSSGHLSPHAIVGLVDSISHAIMAERERCADLSDALAAGFERLAAASTRKRKWNETLALNFRAHADAIRRGGRP